MLGRNFLVRQLPGSDGFELITFNGNEEVSRRYYPPGPVAGAMDAFLDAMSAGEKWGQERDSAPPEKPIATATDTPAEERSNPTGKYSYLNKKQQQVSKWWRHWQQRTASTRIAFAGRQRQLSKLWQQHWQWVISTLIAVASLIITIMAM